MNSTVDLHIHSLYSDDGEFSPTELVQQASKRGIKVMAIADHNCVRANKEAKSAARDAGITYISATEIDCTYQGINLHILGYGIDDESQDFKEIELNISQQSLKASYEMLTATQKLGFDISKEDLMKLAEHAFWKECWTGEMFAEVLLNAPRYREHVLLRPYRTGGTRSDNPYVNFYWDFYSQGKPCYVAFNYPTLEKVIGIIHKNNGYAVLAHPGINLKERDDALSAIMDAGIDGIEAYSSYHLKGQARQFYLEAKQKNLFVTCGSDYHGKTKPSIGLGQHGCESTCEEILSQLFPIVSSENQATTNN